MGKGRLIVAAIVLSGCNTSIAYKGNYCDIASTLYFDSERVVDYLAENDQNLLKEIVIHNETRSELCG